MGRQLTFSAPDAVRSARTVFWEHGFEDSSIPALEAATGLRRSSLYHAFGSKRGLFDAAVASYLEEIVRPRLAALSAAAVTTDAVVDYFTGLRTTLARPGSFTAAHGCLLINAAGAPIARDAALRATVAGYRAQLRAAVGQGVRARFPDRPAPETDRLAETCTALLVCALALTRVDEAAALSSIDTALDLLEAPSVPTEAAVHAVLPRGER